jgi:hypothetical protein
MHKLRLILIYYQTTFVTTIFFNKGDKSMGFLNSILCVMIKGRYLANRAEFQNI